MKIFQESPSELRSRVYGLNGSTDVALKVSSDGTLSVDGTLVATDLDIRDLTATSDSVQMYGFDGSTVQAITTDASGVLAIQDNGSSITVDASDLDIRDLTAASDSVTIYREFTTATQTVTTATDYVGSTSRDVSAKQAYSFWVRNTAATNTALCHLEISPDGTNWLADTSDITVEASTSSIIVANRYLQYARVAYKSTTAGLDTDLEIIWQARS